MNFAVRIIALCIMMPPSAIGLYRWYEFDRMTKSVAQQHKTFESSTPTEAQQATLQRQQALRSRRAERRRDRALQRARRKLRNNRNRYRSHRRTYRRRPKPMVVIQR